MTKRSLIWIEIAYEMVQPCLQFSEGKSTTRLVVVKYYKVIGNEIYAMYYKIALIIEAPHLPIVSVIELFHFRLFFLQ